MAKIEKKTKRYPTDLTDEEWIRIQPFLPGLATSGRPVETDLREVLNAIRYLARTGGGWRMLPKDFPPWPRSTGGFAVRPPLHVPDDPRRGADARP
jgi:transposase